MDQEVILCDTDITIELSKAYSLSHGLKIPDALIASTAIANHMKFFTLNIKDFRFIKELEMYPFKKNERQ